MPDLFMVFDVESVGLHGEGFAVGYVVIDADGNTVAPDGRYACLPRWAVGDSEGRAWIAEKCPEIPANCAYPRDVRAAFWRDWLGYKEQHAALVADFSWPVEARFLAACVDDEPDNEGRPWQGPYPLHEIASFMVAAGLDPHGTYDRLPDEPEHDPLGDARQSARKLVMALKKLKG
jgi:hypothetical protein